MTRKTAPSPRVLGLSHVFGETADLGRAAAFWSGRGFSAAFDLSLAVPAEKRRVLANRSAETVELRYMTIPGTDAGVEFVRHSPASPPPGSPGLSIALRGAAASSARDPEGNELTVHPALAADMTALLRVPDAEAAGAVLARAGFEPAVLAEPELAALRLSGPRPPAWALGPRLFPRRRLRVALIEDRSRPEAPAGDTLGWNGLSLLARDFESVDRELPLLARQEFRSPWGEREVAFHRGGGLILEFLRKKDA